MPEFDQTCKLYAIGPRRGDQIEWMGRKRCPRGASRRGEQKIIKSFFISFHRLIFHFFCAIPPPHLLNYDYPLNSEGAYWSTVGTFCFIVFVCQDVSSSLSTDTPPIQQIGHGGIILFVMLINELLHYQKTTASIRSARPKFRAIVLLRAILVALWTDFKKNLTSLWSYKCMDEWLVSTIISS